MGNFKFKLTEKVEFIEPKSEKEAREKKEGWAEGIIYVDDERIPQSFLEKIQKKFGPIPKGSYFTSNFSTYWEKLAPDYKGEIPDGSKSVSNSYRFPNFAKIFKGFTNMNDDVEFISRNKDVKNDDKIQSIFKKLKDIFNEYRTHLRKTYPAEYEIILKTDGLRGELGGGIEESYYTSAADIDPKNVKYRLEYLLDLLNPPSKENLEARQGIKAALISNNKVMQQNALDHWTKKLGLDEMSTTGGGAGATNFTPGEGAQYATPYAFRKKGQKANDKEYKKLGFKPVKENKNPGAVLGPGPKASEDGVKDNYYVKGFGYKLVPKTKEGTYVQKGSGLEVKNLFEGTTDEFQSKRISAFDDIEQELNHIYKMISNAKDETADYYNENPGSFNVVKPTDLVIDYLKDIKKLLKGEE